MFAAVAVAVVAVAVIAVQLPIRDLLVPCTMAAPGVAQGPVQSGLSLESVAK